MFRSLDFSICKSKAQHFPPAACPGTRGGTPRTPGARFSQPYLCRALLVTCGPLDGSVAPDNNQATWNQPPSTCSSVATPRERASFLAVWTLRLICDHRQIPSTPSLWCSSPFTTSRTQVNCKTSRGLWRFRDGWILPSKRHIFSLGSTTPFSQRLFYRISSWTSFLVCGPFCNLSASSSEVCVGVQGWGGGRGVLVVCLCVTLVWQQNPSFHCG